MSTAFVGGKDFDPVAVADILGEMPAGATVVTGSGAGLETYVREQAPELGLSVLVPQLRPELYDFLLPGLVPVKKGRIYWAGNFFFMGHVGVEKPVKKGRIYWAGNFFFMGHVGVEKTYGPRGKVLGLVKHNRALPLQVNEIFGHALDGTLVIGKGIRGDLARDILKRAKAWPIEVIEL